MRLKKTREISEQLIIVSFSVLFYYPAHKLIILSFPQQERRRTRLVFIWGSEWTLALPEIEQCRDKLHVLMTCKNSTKLLSGFSQIIIGLYLPNICTKWHVSRGTWCCVPQHQIKWECHSTLFRQQGRKPGKISVSDWRIKSISKTEQISIEIVSGGNWVLWEEIYWQ